MNGFHEFCFIFVVSSRVRLCQGDPACRWPWYFMPIQGNGNGEWLTTSSNNTATTTGTCTTHVRTMATTATRTSETLHHTRDTSHSFAPLVSQVQGVRKVDWAEIVEMLTMPVHIFCCK